MRFVGIDLHKDTAFVVVLEGSRRGRVIVAEELPTDTRKLVAFVVRHGAGGQVAVESTSSWHWLVDALRGRGVDVRLAHPKKVRLIAESSKKTDRNDAHELADLLRMGRLPEAHIASKEARSRREILRHRARYVRVGSQAKNRVKAELRKLNVKPPVRDVFTKSGRRWLGAQRFEEPTQSIIDDQMLLIETVEGVAGEIEKRLGQDAEADPRAALLMSIPGVGLFTALTLLAEIDTVERFESSAKLAAYFGLVPRVRSSASKTQHGHMTKQGSRWARWLLIQAAWIAVRRPGRFRNRMQRIRRRRGPKIAAAAVARDIVNVAFRLLKTGQSYSAEEARRKSA